MHGFNNWRISSHSASWLKLHTISNNPSHNRNIFLNCSHSAELVSTSCTRKLRDQRQRDQYGSWCSPLWAAILLMQYRCEPHKTQTLGWQLQVQRLDFTKRSGLWSVTIIVRWWVSRKVNRNCTNPSTQNCKVISQQDRNKHCSEMQKSPQQWNEEKK